MPYVYSFPYPSPSHSSLFQGILNDTVIVDPTKAETEQGRSEFTVAYMPNLQETTLVSQNGKITHAQLEEAMDISIKACSDILKLVMKTALVQSE